MARANVQVTSHSALRTELALTRPKPAAHIVQERREGSSGVGLVNPGWRCPLSARPMSYVPVMRPRNQPGSERLLSESARVQRDILEFAQLSQSTVQSKKITSNTPKHSPSHKKGWTGGDAHGHANRIGLPPRSRVLL